MTYKDLLQQLQQLTEEQLDREVLVYNSKEDFFFDDGTNMSISVNSIPGFIDKDFPYLTV
jgi:hypothetical protein